MNNLKFDSIKILEFLPVYITCIYYIYHKSGGALYGKSGKLE